MAIYSRVTPSILILVTVFVLSQSELHRTKTNWNKSPPNRPTTITGGNSYVAGGLHEKEGIYRNTTGTESENMIDKMEIWCCSILGAILVGLSGIFPLLVIGIEDGPALKHGAGAANLKLLLSFAVGGLLGDVFLHLLPEAWEHLEQGGNDHNGHTRIGLWVIIGMMSFLIIEKAFAKENERDHLDDDEEILENNKKMKQLQVTDDLNGVKHRTKSKNKKSKTKNKTSNNSANKTANDSNKTVQNNSSSNIKVSGYLNLAANVIDNFTHGLAVAGGFLVSMKVGVITTVAILFHEIPHEVGDFAILLRSGFDRWKAAKAQLLTATGGMVGALTALMADSAQAAGDSTVWILPFTSGGFLYIALVTVVPDLLEEKHPRESMKQIVGLLTGIGVMYLVSLVH